MLERTQQGQKVALVVAGLCFLASSAMLGRGQNAIPTSAGILAALATHQGLVKLERQFVFTDWVNQDKA